MQLYTITDKYINILRAYDNRVMFNKNSKRPYVGIVLSINNYDYFAPLSSPKRKHLEMKNKIDFMKIANGQYGVINFNNMIPVPMGELTEIDINNEADNNYKRLLENQANWINKNQSRIWKFANKLYNYLVFPKDNYRLNVKMRCCDFLKLEEVCRLYISR